MAENERESLDLILEETREKMGAIRGHDTEFVSELAGSRVMRDTCRHDRLTSRRKGNLIRSLNQRSGRSPG